MQPYAFAGGRAVVTGAAGGIGEALATQLAARGSHLALLDRDADALTTLAGRLRTVHPALVVSTHVVDLADAGATDAATADVLAADPRVTLLVNNAGVALGGLFQQLSTEDFFWLMDVNFRATVRTTHALLPALRASQGSHLANTSSVYGLFAPAGQSAYAASKFAVRGFTQALRAELVPQGVGVTCVHPGGVRTGIARNSRVGSGVDPEAGRAGQLAFDRALARTTTPQDAAAQVLRGVERRAARVLIGATATVPDLLARLSPVHHPALIARLQRASGLR